MKVRPRALLVGATALGLLALTAACADDERHLTGEVTYRERMALPADAVVSVRLFDPGAASVEAGTLGEEVIGDPGQVPIPFSVTYYESDVDPDGAYVVEAEITSGDETLFTTPAPVPVLTDGHPTEDVELVLVRAG